MSLETLASRGREVRRVIDGTPIGAFLRECAYERRLRNQDPSIRRLNRIMLATAGSFGLAGIALEYFYGPNAGALPLNLSLLLNGITFLDQIGFSRP